MNTFYEYEDILGKAETAHLNHAFQEFSELAVSVRRKLGGQAGLPFGIESPGYLHSKFSIPFILCS